MASRVTLSRAASKLQIKNGPGQISYQLLMLGIMSFVPFFFLFLPKMRNQRSSCVAGPGERACGVGLIDQGRSASLIYDPDLVVQPRLSSPFNQHAVGNGYSKTEIASH